MKAKQNGIAVGRGAEAYQEHRAHLIPSVSGGALYGMVGR